MKYLETYPLFSSKVSGVSEIFDLNTLEGRTAYFRAKAGDKIDALRSYMQSHTFIAYLLAKKSAGKGTYTKQMVEIFGSDIIGHISVGDTVRKASVLADTPEGLAELRDYMEIHYRGFISLDDALDALKGRNQQTLLPTEFTLALLKREIQSQGSKVLFIDGFPRGVDQLSYTLFFRDLIDFRSDGDVFIAIDIPEQVIEERMKSRVVCPICQKPSNVRLLPTEFVGQDSETGEYFLMCDNATCNKERMYGKEGDEAGIESIRERLDRDGELIDKIFSLYGIPKILLRNALPSTDAKDYADTYELTQEYVYTTDDAGNIHMTAQPFAVTDDEGETVVSVSGPAVTLQLIDQLHRILIEEGR